MQKVAILMSTYNGQKYLQEQINSLLSQQGVDVEIIIRDDGSKDNTPSLLDVYAQQDSRITVLKEQNVGVTASFNKLAQYANKNIIADYYAFCDQDDVWEQVKLLVSVDALSQYASSSPNMYFSNLRMVDENLNPIREMYQPGEVKIGPKKALVQVFTYGCTCVFNRKALELFCSVTPQLLCHDHWIFELCTYYGNVFYDEKSHILYRQHGGNVTGGKQEGFSLFKLRLHTFFVEGLDHNFDISAKQLLSLQEEMSPENHKYVYEIAHYRENFMYKLKLLFSKDYKIGVLSKDAIIKFRILINKL